MKLSYLKAGLYRGEVKEYNVKTSDRTGKTYLNLNLDINAFGQQIEVRKSYCLEPGYNFQIMKLMEEVEGMCHIDYRRRCKPGKTGLRGSIKEVSYL